MTRNKDLKKKIRARMARTGERYSTARANLVGISTAKPPPFGGVHGETAAIRSLLHASGIDDPRTKQPLSEAMVLGVGGGLGAAVVVFEYANHTPHLYVATRTGHQYPYTAEFVQTVCERLGVALAIDETTSKAAADRQLRAALATGRPAIAWVDMCSLPYWQRDAKETGALPHMVLVTELDDERATLYDYSRRPFSLPVDALNSARGRLRKARHRLIGVDGTAQAHDLAPAIRAGLRDCVKSLEGQAPAKAMEKNWGLRALAKWAALLDDRRTKKGWPKQFARGPALYAGLRQAYFWIETSGTGGGGFRPLYAEFLMEAAQVLNAPRLATLAATYRDLGDRWTDLAQTMLPDDDSILGETRALLELERDARYEHGPDAVAAISEANARLAEISANLTTDSFPLDDSEVSQLYTTLAGKVQALHDAEVAAHTRLAELTTTV